MSEKSFSFIFLNRDVVLAIHEEQLAQHGGGVGVRDEGLLESALARPANRAAYEPEADCAALAAGYAFGIAKNHPFIDGNKRTAYVAMELSLVLNGFQLIASDEEALMAMLRLASGEIGEAAFAEWIRQNLVPAEDATA
jgi:death-on-curing protein